MHGSFHKGAHFSCHTSSNLGPKRSKIKLCMLGVKSSAPSTNIGLILEVLKLIKSLTPQTNIKHLWWRKRKFSVYIWALHQYVDLTPSHVCAAPPDVWMWVLNNLNKSFVTPTSCSVICPRRALQRGGHNETQHGLTWLNLITRRWI